MITYHYTISLHDSLLLQGAFCSKLNFHPWGPKHAAQYTFYQKKKLCAFQYPHIINYFHLSFTTRRQLPKNIYMSVSLSLSYLSTCTTLFHIQPSICINFTHQRNFIVSLKNLKHKPSLTSYLTKYSPHLGKKKKYHSLYQTLSRLKSKIIKKHKF